MFSMVRLPQTVNPEKYNLVLIFLQKRQRNSLIKDIDPFHQLHEERKGEYPYIVYCQKYTML